MLEIRNVDAFIQHNQVFHNLNLQIADGEKVAILGPNGAGKSTLLKLISREIYPVVKEDSYIRLYGSETVNLWHLRQKIGLITQELQEDYTPYCTAFDVVLSGFFGSIGQHDHLQANDEQKAKAEQLIQQVGMQDYCQQMYQRLSTGQKRRLLLARALVHEPRALIFDEPSNGLDISASHELLKMMRTWCQTGHTLMLATHHVDEIVPEIERVILIKQGQVVADGLKEDVLTSEQLSQLYDIPLQLQQHNGWYRLWFE